MGKKDKTNQAYIGSGEKNNQSGQAASNWNDPYQKYKDFKWEDPDQFKMVQ